MIRHFQKGDCERILKQPEQGLSAERDWFFDCKDTVVYEYEGRVLAIIRPVFELGGRVTLVSYIGADCKDRAVDMYKKLKPMVELLCERYDRVEFTTQADFPQANRLAKLLGFECEGTMRKYCFGKDFNMWGRVR